MCERHPDNWAKAGGGPRGVGKERVRDGGTHEAAQLANEGVARGTNNEGVARGKERCQTANKEDNQLHTGFFRFEIV